uniref:NADH dehydrogenase subunit 6 n=1 Tax=Paracyclopina nana TaxID=565004 RepID=C0J6R7_PARNA|nr:NADH dehydrogenase subunit 6 [Paracyclopina nana]
MYMFSISGLLIFLGLLLVANQSPFVIALMLTVYSMFIGVILGLSGLKWFAFSLILLFLGGMMIVFIYASSLSSSHKLSFSVTLGSLLLITSYFFLLLLFLSSFPVTLSMPYLQMKVLFSSLCYQVICLFGAMLLMLMFLLVKMVKVESGSLKL